MRYGASILYVGILIVGVIASASEFANRAHAQQPSTPTFTQTYEAAFAKTQTECQALWSDHVFDPLRSKIPLGDEKPSFSMLTSKEKLHPKDKPLADLAIKTLEKCRAAYAPVFALLPPQVNSLIQGVQRKQDALIAELYAGKITFGDYNVGMDRLTGELSEALAGISTTRKAEADPLNTKQTSSAVAAAAKPQPQDSVPPGSLPLNGKRVALVIGNSSYVSLPRLSNSANDARSVAEALKAMGYKTQILLDAPEDTVRKEVRRFASESAKADVAVVYYAGHGAQLNGSNYLLPVDIDIPRTEADIQFAGLKVDDLVNSIEATTKIVFLDACRDNPVLFKNIAQGRGVPAVGLAPAASLNLNQSKPGGGIFIAYATDAGSVAEDGKGRHSPFTEALLRYMQRPISIDDMFSMVTKEVRLVTKNAQRPYKYASLENIICLTPSCSSSPSPIIEDIQQQARQSEGEELEVALQTNNPDALETYLQKYPDTTKRSAILTKIAALKRSEFTEWTLYEVGNLHNPFFMQLSSIQQFGDKAAAKTKSLVDPLGPKIFYGKSLPDAAYLETLNVYDCKNPTMAIAEEAIFNNSGELIFHYKWADPQYLNLSIGVTLATGSVGLTGKKLACNEEIGTPLVTKEQIAAMKFQSLSSTIAGDGEIFYKLKQNNQDAQDAKKLIMIIRSNADHNVNDFFPVGTSIPDPPNYRTEVDDVLLKCDENQFAIGKTEFWNASNELVRLQAVDPAAIKFSEFKQFSPFATLQEIVCRKGYAGVGIRFEANNGLIRVAEVFDGSPAQKAGVKVNDVITHIDDEPLGGLPLEQVFAKLRGPANSKISLTILRTGQDKPLVLTATRQIIQPQSSQQEPPK